MVFDSELAIAVSTKEVLDEDEYDLNQKLARSKAILCARAALTKVHSPACFEPKTV